MQINSVDQNCSLSIEKNCDPDGYSSYGVEIHVDLGHGCFQGRNSDFQFLGIEDFVRDLDAFLLDRTRTPRLEGTYNSFFRFSAAGNAVFLEFCLGDAFCGRETVFYSLSGKMEVEAGSLMHILSAFGDFLRSK